ncbi:MAG TPA: M20 family metallo-hydrolase [Gaiellaceae bacterium]|nr:M20 family metallo-hydrolase [Gaiellaceae bacterium]
MSAERILVRCNELARLSEEEGLLTRWYGSQSLAAAADLVAEWMERAGLEVRRDAVGNVIGRRVGGGEGTFVLGSHIDTVRDAGRFDGPLGVILAIEAAEAVSDPRCALEVTAFIDEEGGLFSSVTYLGSSGWAGLLSPDDAALTDSEGGTFGDAILAMGGDPARLAERSAPDDLLGYLEVHIEQGPVLQDEDLSVGIVTAIAAQSRGTVVFSGMAGHAGNTPMRLRHDALPAAAELVLEVERLARHTAGLTATVGRLSVEPNVGNVIPGQVAMTYDVRHQEDGTRDRARDALEAAAREIAQRRGLELAWTRRWDLPAVPMSERLRGVLADACTRTGVPPRELASGAGHDAVTAAKLADAAMLFVRCRDGISHHPDESVREQDVAVALDVVVRFLGLLGDPKGPQQRST